MLLGTLIGLAVGYAACVVIVMANVSEGNNRLFKNPLLHMLSIALAPLTLAVGIIYLAVASVFGIIFELGRSLGRLLFR